MNTNEFYLDPMGTIDNAYQSIEVTALTAKYLIDRLLWQRGEPLVLGRLFDRRPPGDGDVAELPVNIFDGIVDGDPVYDLQALQPQRDLEHGANIERL